MLKHRAVQTERAPAAVGAYSQAVVAGELLFVSGQIPLDPATGRLVDSADVRDHARRVLDNLTAVLEAGGCSLEDVVKASIFLADIGDFAAVNEVYASYFATGIKPARAAVQVGALPLGARVEIEAVALIPG